MSESDIPPPPPDAPPPVEPAAAVPDAPPAPAFVPPVFVVPSPPAPPPPRLPWWQMARPALTLGLAGFALVFAIQSGGLRPDTRFEFLSRNYLGAHGRMILLVTQGLGFLLPVLAAAALWLWRRRDGQRLADRAAALTAPLIPLGLLSALLNPQLSHVNQLNWLLLLGLFAVMFEPLMRHSLEAAADLPVHRLRALLYRLPALPRSTPLVIVLLGATFYAAYTGYFTIMNHHRIGTTAFDLGIYDNLMWNALHGHPFQSPVLFGPKGGNYIAGHAEFAMLLFVPFYAIRPGAETMLIIQAILFGFAAVPLYLFAATQVSRRSAAVVALAYLLFAPLHGPNFYDFHWLPLAVFFHFWLYYAIATRRHWLTLAMLLVLFAMREDVAVGLCLLGVFLLVTGVRAPLGLLLAVVSGVWFGLVRFVIMPRAGNWYFQIFYNDLFADGESSFASVIKTVMTNPVYFLTTLLKETKLQYGLHLLAPLAFLPCRRWSFLLLLIPGSVFTLMTTSYAPVLSISFQYTTHWIPYLFLATVLALVVLGRQAAGLYRQRAALVTLAVVVVAHSFNFGAILQRSNFIGGFSKIEFSMTPSEVQQYAAFKELLAMIPRDASVAATEHEVPHVSARKIIYPMRYTLTPVDYILLGRSHLDNREVAQAALADPAYGLLAQRRNEFYLFKRGHVSEETVTAKRELGF